MTDSVTVPDTSVMVTRKAVKKPDKTATKTASRPGKSGYRLPVGAHPGNTGGKPGRSGRPPNEFKAMCADLVSSPEAQEQIRSILTNANHPAFASVFKAVAPYGYGQPKQDIGISGEMRHAVVILPALDPAP